MKISNFWAVFEDDKLIEELSVNQTFKYVCNCNLEELQKVCIEYRFG
jgi:ABC-type multidrug transport system ATPase subunit